MKDLVIMKNKQAVTTSLEVARVFEKEHRNVLRDIDKLKKDVLNFEQMFEETQEPDSYGRSRRVIYMNRDGFTLLAMGFTGDKALKFKLKYINAFNNMEQVIKEQALPQTPEEKLALTMKVAGRLDKRVTKIEEDVSDLKENAEIDSDQRYELERTRRAEVMHVVGGASSNYYQEKKARKVFSKISKNFHDAFHVSRYEDVKKKDFSKAIDYIKNWYPPYDLQNEIKELNAQTRLPLN